MRLTQKKKPHGYEIVSNIETERGTCITTQLLANHKLGQLEDLEEELGIDLVTLFKALKDSMWFKYIDKETMNTYILNAHNYMKPILDGSTIEIQEYVDNGGGYWFKDFYYVFLKDYGKTWALTKEELE